MVEAGWNQTLVISVLERRLQQYWGCIPSRWGKSSRGIVIATPSSQWIQTATNYFKPQEENLLHENDTSHHIPMSRHTCSPVLSKLSFFITIGCPVYVVLYKWFDVMTCLDSTCYLFVNNLSIKMNITPHRLILYPAPGGDPVDLIQNKWVVSFLLSVFAWCELCFRSQREITNRFRSGVISTLFRGSVYVACRLPQ